MTTKYWYRTTFDFCPACGRQSLFKQRVVGEKPENHEERFITTETYDYCIEQGRM